MKGKAKAGYVFIRVLEALHWLGAALCVFMAVSMAAAPDWFSSLLGYEPAGETLYYQMVQYGFLGGLNMVVTGQTGFDTGLQALMMAGDAATSVLGALTFRRIGEVIKACQTGTPFQKPVVQKVRQIGWLVIAVPLVTVAVSFLSYVLCWPGHSFQVDVSGLITGVIVLALSRIFAYGVKLEDDVEGLL